MPEHGPSKLVLWVEVSAFTGILGLHWLDAEYYTNKMVLYVQWWEIRDDGNQH